MIARIEVAGCDDVTVCHVDMTEAEFNFLHVIAALITEASDYSCQPRMRVDASRLPEESAA